MEGTLEAHSSPVHPGYRYTWSIVGGGGGGGDCKKRGDTNNANYIYPSWVHTHTWNVVKGADGE